VSRNPHRDLLSTIRDEKYAKDKTKPCVCRAWFWALSVFGIRSRH
jgi:hypothetical protein